LDWKDAGGVQVPERRPVSDRDEPLTKRRPARGRTEVADALLARARAGDRDAFDRLAVLAVPRLLGTARRLLGDPLEAEESVAEALVRAYRRLARFRMDARFETWVHRILCRVVVDRFRARARDGRRLESLRGRAGPETPSPLQRLSRREDGDRLRAAVGALPPVQRLVVVLHVWEGLALTEVAALLGTRYATAKSNLHHARLALRDRLGEEETR
jgi:RNA polymerase sigma-70 factor (ECF subfamily)